MYIQLLGGNLASNH